MSIHDMEEAMVIDADNARRLKAWQTRKQSAVVCPEIRLRPSPRVAAFLAGRDIRSSIFLKGLKARRQHGEPTPMQFWLSWWTSKRIEQLQGKWAELAAKKIAKEIVNGLTKRGDLSFLQVSK